MQARLQERCASPQPANNLTGFSRNIPANDHWSTSIPRSLYLYHSATPP